MSIYTTKLLFVHENLPHPKIETRRLGLMGSTDEALYAQLMKVIHTRIPSRNRLAKYVVKRVETMQGKTIANVDDFSAFGRSKFHNRNSGSEDHVAPIGKAEEEEATAAAARDHRIIQLRVVVNEETNEEALLSLSPEDLAVGGGDLECYDEHIMDQLDMEEFAAKFAHGKSSENSILCALKELPTVLSDRVQMIIQKLHTEKVPSQDEPLQVDANDTDASELVEQQQHEQIYIHEQTQEQEEDEQKMEIVQQESLEQEEEKKEEAEEPIDHEKVADESSEGIVEDDGEVNDEGQSDRSDDSIFESFVVVGKDGKRCLDDQLENTSTLESSSSSSSLVFVQEETDPNNEKLSLMKEMGFDDEDKNRQMLLKYDGNLVKAVQDLMMAF